MEYLKIQVLVYPNPVINNATLEYELKNVANVSIEILSIDRKTVKQIIVNTQLNSGKHVIEIPLSNFATGTYFLRLIANNSFTTIKLIKP